jgi:hypothetical protein
LPFLREEEAKWGEVGEDEERGERGEAGDGDAGESIFTVFVTAFEVSTFNGVPSIGCGGMYGVLFLRGDSEDDDRVFLLLLALLGEDGADAEPPLPILLGEGDVSFVAAVAAVAAAVVLDAGVTGDDESVCCGNVCGGAEAGAGEAGVGETGAAESGGGKKLEGSGSCFFA